MPGGPEKKGIDPSQINIKDVETPPHFERVEIPIPKDEAIELPPAAIDEIDNAETEYFSELRERMEDGDYPSLWEIVSKFEIPDYPDDIERISPLKSRLEDERLLAEASFDRFLDELKEIQETGTEEDVLNRILKRMYVDSKYRVTSNGFVKAYTDPPGDVELNCEGRAKAIATALEGLGYDQEEGILTEWFSDHVRTLVKTRDGKTMLMEGGKLSEWQPTEGAPVVTLKDLKRMTAGLDPEKAPEFSGSNIAFHGDEQKDKRIYGNFAQFSSRSDATRETRVLGTGIDRTAIYGQSEPPTVVKKLANMFNLQLSAGQKKLTKYSSRAAAVAMLLFGAEKLRQSDINSVADLTEAVQQKADDLKGVAEEVAEAIERAFQEEKAQVDRKEKESVPPKSPREVKNKPFEIHFQDSLPRGFKEKMQRQYGVVDYIVDEDSHRFYAPDSEVAKEYQGFPDMEILRITPSVTETEVTDSYWRYVLRQMLESAADQEGEFPERLVIDFRTDNPDFKPTKKRTSVIASWRSVRLTVLTNGKVPPDSPSASNVLLDIRLNGKEYGLVKDDGFWDYSGELRPILLRGP